jgi:hypothetical protein
LKEAPFYLMFSREAILPADFRAGINSDDIFAEAHPNDTFNHVQVVLDEEEEKFTLTPPSVDYYPKSTGEIGIMTLHNKHLKSIYHSVYDYTANTPLTSPAILGFCQK